MGNDPNRSEKQQATDQKAPQSPPPSLANKKEERQGGTDGDGLHPEGNHQEPPETLWGRFKAWVFPVAFTDAVMLLLTAFIALGTIVSAVAIGFQWSEMHSGSSDTKAIAGASKIQARAARTIADASKRNASAAESFAGTAALIKSGIDDAVGKLAAQSKASQEMTLATVSDNRAWIVPDALPQHRPTIQQANLEWHNVGKSPAVSVFNMTEYFIGNFPSKLRGCRELERVVKKAPPGTSQFQPFVAQGGLYEIGLAGMPKWEGPAPLNIHGCIWYTDVLSNTERTSEFFCLAVNMKYALPESKGVSIFYDEGKPLHYR